jgi:putative N6-adenine-specific DNA methylase
MCGTGAILIEAAMLGLNQAPGLNRTFAAEAWPTIPAALWREARQEAADLLRREPKLLIRGSDIDKKVVEMARRHAQLAGLENRIHWQQAPLAELQSRQKYGYLISNPPYGQRLEETATARRLYRELGQICKGLDTWSCYILTTHKDFEKLFGKKASKKRKLYNGRLQCDYYQFYGPKPTFRPKGEESE